MLGQAFVEGLHKKNISFVPIVDPAIKAEKGDAPYDAGIAADILHTRHQWPAILGPGRRSLLPTSAQIL